MTRSVSQARKTQKLLEPKNKSVNPTNQPYTFQNPKKKQARLKSQYVTTQSKAEQ